MRRVMVTGSNGFLGRNFVARLTQRGLEPIPIGRHDEPVVWQRAVREADAIAHLAGVTQSDDADAFRRGNVDTALLIARAVGSKSGRTPLAYASTTKVNDPTPYGQTKREAERILLELSARHDTPLSIFRLPHVFGPMARTHYNSIVVTMCADHAAGRPLSFNNPDGALTLAYVDDVVDAFLNALCRPAQQSAFPAISPLYRTTVGEVATAIRFLGGDEPQPAIDARLLGALAATYRFFCSDGAPERALE